MVNKLFIYILLCTISTHGYSQIQPGFDKLEALEMIQLCNSYTFLELYNSDSEIIPNNYEKYYTSGVFGMDNKYQIYLKDSIAVINFRGSTSKQISWLENMHSAMIPATGTIHIQGDKFEYSFAKDSTASVHGGFALGLAYIYRNLLFHINILNSLGYYNIVITGHSQGGALSNLFYTYLNNLPNNQLSDKNRFKVYAFAAPKIGNQAFVNEYNSKYCEPGFSYNIVNPSDNIPKLPTSFNASGSQSNASDTSMPVNYKSLLLNASYTIFSNSISKLVKKVSVSTAKKISKELGNVSMPEYTNEINYPYLGNEINIPSFSYPKILKDSSILQNDSLMVIYVRDEYGVFDDKDLYESAPFGYQHKPYNYYAYFLLKYFPEKYNMLERKYLLENL